NEIIVKRAFVLQVLLGLSARNLVERWLSDVDAALLDQSRHLPEEKREQKCADVRTVDVGVRHDDDLMIAELRRIEIVATDTRAERCDQRADLLRGQHLVEAR